MNERFGVLILAAGSSSQAGRPRQLLPYLGRTLIEHAARTAIASGAAEIVVVLGAEAELIRKRLAGLPVKIVINRDWQEGIASSIRCGVRAFGSEIKCAVLSLSDQRCITPGLFRDLAHRHFTTLAPIVASSYDGVIGAPSAFGAEFFARLLSLEGPFGARDLIRQSQTAVETVEFCAGNVRLEEPAPTWQTFTQPCIQLPRDVYQEPQDARGPPLFRSIALIAT